MVVKSTACLGTGLSGVRSRRCGHWRHLRGEVTMVTLGSVQNDEMRWNNLNLTKKSIHQASLENEQNLLHQLHKVVFALVGEVSALEWIIVSCILGIWFH